jgi:hypothetical protein
LLGLRADQLTKDSIRPSVPRKVDARADELASELNSMFPTGSASKRPRR